MHPPSGALLSRINPPAPTPPPLQAPDLRTLPPLQMLASRYGFIRANASQIPNRFNGSQLPEERKNVDVAWRNALRAAALNLLDLPTDVTDEAKSALIFFFDELGSQRPYAHDLSRVWDMVSPPPVQMTSANAPWTLPPHPPVQTLLSNAPWTLQFSVYGDRQAFIIQAHEPSVPWLVVLWCPQDVCTLARLCQPQPTNHDIALLLFRNGMSFGTFDHLAPSRPDQNITTMWPRSIDARFQPVNYRLLWEEYKETARIFLRTPAGRSAFLKGGILWRIAVELAGRLDAWEAVEAGPFVETANTSRAVDLGDRTLRDDDLTDGNVSHLIGEHIFTLRK